MTNEIEVSRIEAKVAELKEAYINYIEPLAHEVRKNNTTLEASQYTTCQRLGNAYFNALENFVANSGLLSAHLNGKWVTNLAETCHTALVSYYTHITFLRSHSDCLGDAYTEPDKHAMAGMQRMVKEYLEPETFEALFKKFSDAKLPIQGFTVKAHEDVKKISTAQLISCTVLGVVIMAISIGLSLYAPNPTPYQTFVFRTVLAVGLSMLIAGVPGFINVKFKASGLGQYFKAVAGGAIAVFLVIYLVNPAELAPSAPPSTVQPPSSTAPNS
ncbi:hypothetical protein [Pseudomonas sp. FP1740]|uniref:hypothetical protein n=1 Tax=Pseudomonas sp. FP1740 TaxID=2954078 RepID=UPI002736E6F5|nr:hypothetical protein [Pseudomonas sp. FP1740]WLG46423.1 hypothetical protein PSH69_07350 [Pseudomonas sp. FP1740]